MKKTCGAILLILSLLTWGGCQNEVSISDIKSISLDKEELVIQVGDSFAFKVSHTPSDIPAPEYYWEVSKTPSPTNPGMSYYIASISQNGVLKAVREGEIYVTVYTQGMKDPATHELFRTQCRVTIVPAKAKGLTLDKSSVSINSGDMMELTCSFSDKAMALDLKWESSDASIVQVKPGSKAPATMELTGLLAGEATVTVSLKSKPEIKAICAVKVNAAKLEGLSFTENEKTVLQGEKIKVTPVFNPSNAHNKQVKWSSSDIAVATVDEIGSVTAIRSGECIIKAVSEDGGFEASYTLIVKPLAVTGISFAKDYYRIEVGGTRTLVPSIVPEDAGNKKVSWKSSGPEIVTVDENGLIKANTKGQVVITATTEDGGYMASTTVTVVDIQDMMVVNFPSSSLAIINGFYTGSINCSITNTSSQSVKLTKFYIIDTNTYRNAVETTDESLLGPELAPGKTVVLSARLNSVYEPSFCWMFEWNGLSFSTSKLYGYK